MTLVVIDDRELTSKRQKAIREFLSPLASSREVACNLVRTPVNGGRILAAHDGQVGGREYRDWRFASKHRNITCQYFELWRPINGGKSWFLDRAYLTLFLVNRSVREERELLAVHADPNNGDSDPIRYFKKGPHLHVKHVEDPLPHAHFPMTIGFVERATESTPELTRVLSQIVSLLASEVVGRFEQG